MAQTTGARSGRWTRVPGRPSQGHDIPEDPFEKLERQLRKDAQGDDRGDERPKP